MLGYSDNSLWPIEIDALEAFGAPNDAGDGNNNQYHWNYFFLNETDNGPGKWIDVASNITEDYHAYGTLWTQKSICYYFDGVKTAEGPTPESIQGPMYMIANLAVGGSWPGYPDNSTPFPANMKIDWIRAYSLINE
eukprot:TRINITY_DN10414_c0_g1_i4.p1 TRINITY_DN10414_c0_g1~~TRINITY_DN10414_c0_g1_i4.p1  ORF type:complete len:136 (+),score=20.37 TRINITY_DN10414_c0_g1_i4:237-644(+)